MNEYNVFMWFFKKNKESKLRSVQLAEDAIKRREQQNLEKDYDQLIELIDHRISSHRKLLETHKSIDFNYVEDRGFFYGLLEARKLIENKKAQLQNSVESILVNNVKSQKKEDE